MSRVAKPVAVSHGLRARRIGIDTHYEAVVFMNEACHVCRSEGFAAQSRVLLRAGLQQTIATLFKVTGDLVAPDEAALSESAWRRLGLQDGAMISVSHPDPVDSLALVRSRIYGQPLSETALESIIADVVAGRYSDIDLAAFLTACTTQPLNRTEVLALTKSMVDAGEQLTWTSSAVLDKHSVGGLPGNRTTPLIVSIVAAQGLTIPKTSSRAITSPAGTADMMETLAPVEHDTADIHRIVEQEGGCIVWGGSVRLSPADDILIRVERALDIDSEGQLIASVLSKKIAAGATHLVLDIPVGPTAKLRSVEAAEALAVALIDVAAQFGIQARAMFGDGRQPIGRGMGPALEAHDVLAVLQGHKDAPADLRARAITLAGALLELGGVARAGTGERVAAETLENGRAWAKFQRICEAQGGMRVPPIAPHQHPMLATRAGRVVAIDNRKIAKVAKLSGAPEAKAAGVAIHVRLGDRVERGSELCTVHAQSPGELEYALAYAAANPLIVRIEDP
jgi:thymidine phosphorylase